MSGSATYKPIVGVAGKPVATIPFGLMCYHTTKHGVVMASPDPYGHSGYVRDTSSSHASWINLIENGLEGTLDDYDWGVGISREAEFNLHYKPGEIVRVTFEYSVFNAQVYGRVKETLENVYQFTDVTNFPSVQHIFTSDGAAPKTGVETHDLNNLYYRFPVRLLAGGILVSSYGGDGHAWVKITLANV